MPKNSIENRENFVDLIYIKTFPGRPLMFYRPDDETNNKGSRESLCYFEEDAWQAAC
jgi:hypothetical protein